jgi:hypothetical protein
VHQWVRAGVQAGELVDLPRDLYYPIWIGPAQELTRQLLAGRARRTIAAERHLADTAWKSLRANYCHP